MRFEEGDLESCIISPFSTAILVSSHQKAQYHLDDIKQSVRYRTTCQQGIRDMWQTELKVPISLLELLDGRKTQVGSHGRYVPDSSFLFSLLKRRLVVAHSIVVSGMLGCRCGLNELRAKGIVLVDFLIVIFQISFCDFDNADEFVDDRCFGIKSDNSRFAVGWC
jgi:hypothetical protein